MNLKSHLFDRIRVRPPAREAVRPDVPRCQHPGCSEAGEFRAPMGRLLEGHYFCFCLDHVRKYNASYNYFDGMTAEMLALFQREALVGHRPTWPIGANGARAFADYWKASSRMGESVGRFGGKFGGQAAAAAQPPRYRAAALKALSTLGLDANVDMAAIKARYKELVKRLHPDANAGDRSNEERLREIIRAYNYLKSVRHI